MQACTGGVVQIAFGNTADKAASAWCLQQASKSAAAEQRLLLMPVFTGAVKMYVAPFRWS